MTASVPRTALFSLEDICNKRGLFLGEKKIHFSKPPLSVEDQVKLLVGRGLVVTDFDFACRCLSNVGYYRFSAFCVPYETSIGKNHKFQEDTSFEEVLNLYNFDRELRVLFWEALECIEIKMRASFALLITTKTKDPFAHLNEANFVDSEKHKENIKQLKTDIYRSQAETFVKHFISHYDEETPPLWACVHLMSLGELVRWIDNVKDSEIKKELSQGFGFSKYFTFHSFAVALTELRNVCAHHVRMWNRSFMKRTVKIKKFDCPGFEKSLPLQSSNKLYSLAILLAVSMKTSDTKTTWPSRVGAVLRERPSWQIKSMGFPKNWQDLEVFL